MMEVDRGWPEAFQSPGSQAKRMWPDTTSPTFHTDLGVLTVSLVGDPTHPTAPQRVKQKDLYQYLSLTMHL